MLRIIEAAAEQLTKQQVWEQKKYAGTAPGRSGQDALLFSQENGIFAVADGIGSRPHSNLAAEMAVRVFANTFVRHGLPNTAAQARERIQDGLIDRLQYATARTQGATTLTGMIVTPDGQATYLNAGDSQFLIRRTAHVIRQTSEQSVKEGDGHAMHGLYNFFGMVEGYDPTRPPRQLTDLPNVATIDKGTEWGSVELECSDRLILVTDGVIGDRYAERLSELDWRGLTQRSLGVQACAHSLVHLSKKIDDKTAVVVDIDRRRK